MDNYLINDLHLFITNDAEIYRRFTTPVIKNLVDKKRKNVYDPVKGMKAFLHVINNSKTKISRSYGDIIMLPDEKKALAEKLLEHYQDEINVKTEGE